MVWYIFSLLNAFFESLKDVSSKKGLKDFDEYTIAWALRFFSLPFLLPLLFFFQIPQIGNQFWVALIAGGLLSVVTTILYMKAIKSSDLSLTIPLVTFTPLFLLLTSPIMVGEFPTIFGLIGVLLIVIGSYTLNITKKTQGLLGPFKALIKESGPRYMLIVAFIWSITANFDKIGILDSSPIFWVIAFNVFLSLVMFPIMLYKSRKTLSRIPANLKSLIPIGLFSSLSLIFQMTAISLTLVTYAISIKRTSSIFSVIFGHLIFKEKGIKERLIGTIIMVIGVLFITLL